MARTWSPPAGDSPAPMRVARCACTPPTTPTGCSVCPRRNGDSPAANGDLTPGTTERVAIGSITALLVPRALERPVVSALSA